MAKINKYWGLVAVGALTAAAAGAMAAHLMRNPSKKECDLEFDFDDDFDDMFDDEETEKVVPNREYVKMDPTKMSADTCEE